MTYSSIVHLTGSQFPNQSPRVNRHSVQRACRVSTGTLELDFLQIMGFRTVITAVVLAGLNLALALLMTAFVHALRIYDVFHVHLPSFPSCKVGRPQRDQRC